MISSAPGHRCAANYVRPKRGLALISGTVVAVSLACGSQDALVGAQDPDQEGPRAEAATSGTDRSTAGTSTGGARSTGKAGGAPKGGTGGAGTGGDGTEGGTKTTGGTSQGGGGAVAAGGSGGGARGYTCAGVAGDDIAACPPLGPLDGRLMQFPCANSSVTDDCDSLGYVVDGVVTLCSAGRSEMVLDHPIAGPPGARYLITMHFYGIMEPKNLGPNAAREAAPLAPDRNGGGPYPWATVPAGASYYFSDYSAYELSVHDEGGQNVSQYFLNADVSDGHWTFLIDYEKTIEVVAGGFVRLRRYDDNCRLIKNCGTTGGSPCASKARTIDLSAANPPAPMDLFQPGLGKDAEHAGQWWLIDVTAVEPL